MAEIEEEKTTRVVTGGQPVVTSTKRVVKQPAVKVGHPQEVYEVKKSIFRTYQVVWYILGVIEILLAFRLIFKVIGANPLSAFVQFIYNITDVLALPFAGILGESIAPRTGSVMEWSTLVAMAVYWLLAYGIIKFLQFMKPVTPQEVSETVDTQ